MGDSPLDALRHGTGLKPEASHLSQKIQVPIVHPKIPKMVPETLAPDKNICVGSVPYQCGFPTVFRCHVSQDKPGASPLFACM